MKSNIRITTLNVRSIQDYKKRKSLCDWLTKHHNGIFFLQETHSVEENFRTWFTDWNFEVFVSHGTSNSRGVAILIPKSMNPVVHWQQTDNAGRIIIVNVTLDNENFTLANCYFPTKNKQKEQI